MIGTIILRLLLGFEVLGKLLLFGCRVDIDRPQLHQDLLLPLVGLSHEFLLKLAQLTVSLVVGLDFFGSPRLVLLRVSLLFPAFEVFKEVIHLAKEVFTLDGDFRRHCDLFLHHSPFLQEILVFVQLGHNIFRGRHLRLRVRLLLLFLIIKIVADGVCIWHNSILFSSHLSDPCNQLWVGCELG